MNEPMMPTGTMKPEDKEIIAQEKFPKPEEFLTLMKDKGLEEHAEAYEKVLELASVIKQAGGQALLVGGSVRDMMWGKTSKDFDIEVYGLEPDKIREVATSIGKADLEVGKAFGIIKVFIGNIDLDISLPRTDSKMGEGHNDFAVNTDPNMSIKEAAKRRDFTMNSIAADPLTGDIFDGYGGLQDIKERRLRITDEERFKDDPLRVLRGVQFIARFGLEVEPKTMQAMQEMVPQLKHLSQERILEEWKKLLLKSEKPSTGLTMAMALGVIRELHPELLALNETDQEEEWHPEGNVWIHTLMVVDEAAKVIRQEGLEGNEAFVIMMAALCHDLGKPETTEIKDGRITSIGHEQKGEEPTKQMLSFLKGIKKKDQDKIVKLVTNHMMASMLYMQDLKAHEQAGKDGKVKGAISDGAIRKLADRIHPATIRELVMVCQADHFGRGTFPPETVAQMTLNPTEFKPGPWLMDRARKVSVEDSKPEPLTQGRDWIAIGYKPGKQLGQLIRLSNELRDEKGFDRERVFASVLDMTADEAIEKMESLLKE